MKNDGDLTSMRAFKQAMIRYTNYIKKNNFEMGSELYFDILANMCDKDMRLKLESINGVREAGEEKLWEIIEEIYQESNPTYIRRVKVYELQMNKGELCGDFATRLKLDYQESEMAKATVWSQSLLKRTKRTRILMRKGWRSS